MVFWDLKTCSLVDRHSSSLKAEELGSSEVLVPIWHTSWCQIAEDWYLASSLTLMWEVYLLLFEHVPRTVILTESPCFNLGPFAEQTLEG
jgi:hypothetical protein